jgi:hypothetical protein
MVMVIALRILLKGVFSFRPHCGCIRRVWAERTTVTIAWTQSGVVIVLARGDVANQISGMGLDENETTFMRVLDEREERNENLLMVIL